MLKIINYPSTTTASHCIIIVSSFPLIRSCFNEPIAITYMFAFSFRFILVSRKCVTLNVDIRTTRIINGTAGREVVNFLWFL